MQPLGTAGSWMWGLVLEDPHNLCGCYWGLGVAAPRLQIRSPGPHCRASLQGLPRLELLPQGQVQAGTQKRGAGLGRVAAPERHPQASGFRVH